MSSTFVIIIKTKTFFFSMIILALISASIVSYYCWRKQPTPPNSFMEILDHYGFETPEQKEALEFLMKKAGILKPTESLHTLFPKRTTTSLLFQDLLKFVELTQQYFTVRTGNQERWEVKPAEWMNKNQIEILNSLNKLGMINKVAPMLSNPDVICILGARTSAMATRLQYAGELFNKKTLQAKYLILLAGERKVIVGIDETEVELSAVAQKYGVSLGNLTETHMIRESYTNSSLFNKLLTEVIDTPAGKLPRPTTETTLLEFCKWLQDHPDAKSVSFVSNQPHVKYQQAIIGEVLRQQGKNIKFEVIGSAISPDIKIQELIGALGSQIWAETPNVFAKTKMTTTNPELLKAFLELYAKQPLIYKNVESLLKENK